MEYSHSALATCARAYHAALAQAKTSDELEHIRVQFLGRNGEVTALMAELKTMSNDDRRRFGPEFNHFKEAAQEALTDKLAAIATEQQKALDARRAQFDVTGYMPGMTQGSLHPITHLIEQIENTLLSMGFEIIDGPEVETEEVNFEALNIPPHHPARDMQDTFWLTLPRMLLRTHTSTAQIRGMRARQAPLAVASTGRAFRNEATDASHDFIFMQCEGLLIDKKISMANLFATTKTFLQSLFKTDKINIRIRPSFFPFVEPGIEIDMSCPFCTDGCSTCKHSHWIEICGAGLVHPNVLRAGNINPDEYSGFAFGFGLTRLAMMYYGISDIRLLHSGRIDFLSQF